MTAYLTEIVYQRWYRQYYNNLGHWVNVINHLKERLEELPYDTEVDNLEELISDIDLHLEKVRPRDFINEPLMGVEKFIENAKVLANLLFGFFGVQKRFLGIYQKEKNRVLKSYQDAKIKENLQRVQERIEALQHVEDVAEKSSD